MSKIDITKKPALEDWHPADIVCALRKAGWSLRRLSYHYGYTGSLKNALHTPWPRAERLIAEAIGITPEQIWPRRYADPAHLNKVGKALRWKKLANNNTTRRARRNGYIGGAA